MNLSIRRWLATKFSTSHYRKALNLDIVAGVSLRIINELEVKSLTIFDICTLVEILELPLKTAWQEIPGIIQLTQSLLANLSQKMPLKRNEGTWLGYQIAYLQALQQILDQEVRLKKPWLNRAMFWNQEENDTFLVQDTHLQGLLKTLNPGKLSDTQAEQALSLIADSLLVQQMNSATTAWFMCNGAEEVEAKLMVQRLSNSLLGHLLGVVVENAAALAQLQKFVQLGKPVSTGVSVKDAITTMSGDKSLTVFASEKIDLYRELYRASLLQSQAQPLFLESFSLKDIYVPLKGLPIEESDYRNGQKILQPVDLNTWVEDTLDDLENITLIESEAGYGKTSFCQMFANHIAEKLYPHWMPIFIRLCDVTYNGDLIKTLCSGLPQSLSIHFTDWLQLESPKCILILDGLDELKLTGNGISKTKFIQQLLSLQYQSHHKVLLTSRLEDSPLIIHELTQLRRIKIQPFQQEELRLWFQQWAMVQSMSIAQNFFSFLKQAGLFVSKSKSPELSTLVRQPLILYLLGVLYRDGLFDDEILDFAVKTQQHGNSSILWKIYQLLNRWLLGYPLTGGIKPILVRQGSAHIHRTQDAIINLLQSHLPEDILMQMHNTALQILHSQRHSIYIDNKTNTLPAFYFETFTSSSDIKGLGMDDKNLSTNQNPALTNAKFSHSRLGEFLCAEAIVSQLQLLTQQNRNSWGESNYTIESVSDVAQHLYNLLGFGMLTPSIEALVIEGLRRINPRDFSLTILCERLLSFWYPYCQGRWIDEGITHKAWHHFQSLQNSINVEQINAAVGINIFFLLCACHCELKRTFFPCRHPSHNQEFIPEAFAQLINRTNILAPYAFQKRISPKSLACVNLSEVNLTQVSLAFTNLEAINLSNANLVNINLAGANLAGANLAGANLAGANLTDANLCRTNLSGANLMQANLTGVKLQSAILTNACLYNTVITQEDKDIARLNGAMFVLEEYQALKRLLSQQSRLEASHIDFTSKTDIWLSNLPEIGLIESIEGEMLPEDLYEDDADDETVIGV